MPSDLLQHALANNCTDPDCELHNLDVAFDEEVITDTEGAYFYAGACVLADLLATRGVSALDLGEALAKLRHYHKLEGR